MKNFNLRRHTALLAKNNTLHITSYAAPLFFARALSDLSHQSCRFSGFRLGVMTFTVRSLNLLENLTYLI